MKLELKTFTLLINWVFVFKDRSLYKNKDVCLEVIGFQLKDQLGGTQYIFEINLLCFSYIIGIGIVCQSIILNFKKKKNSVIFCGCY